MNYHHPSSFFPGSRAAARAALLVAAVLGGAAPPASGEEPVAETLHVRGEPTGVQMSLLESLQAKTGGEVAVRYRDDGTLRYLAALDAAPECRLGGPLDERAAELLSCFVESNAGLLFRDGELEEGVTWRLTRTVEPAEDGLAQIRARQTRDGFDVKGAEIVLNLRQDRVVSFGGTLLPRARLIPDFVLEARDRAEIEELVSVELGRPFYLATRVFDPERGELVAYLVDLDDQTADVASFTETSGEVEILPLGAEYTSEVARSDVSNYESAWKPDGTLSNRQLAVDRLSRNGSSCRVGLDAGSDISYLVGNPKTYLANGTDKGGSLVEDTANPCGSFAFLGYPAQRIGRAANAHFWVSDLARFTRSGRAGYRSYIRYSEPENLRVVLQQTASCSAGAPACMWPTVNIFGAVTEWRMVLAENRNRHDNLRTMAHEMGHFVGYSYDHYDMFGDRDLLDGATEEGFADQNVLRYAMYRLREEPNRPHDRLFTSDHGTDHWGSSSRSHIVEQRYHNGESAPMGHNGTFQHLVYRPGHSGSPCHASNPVGKKYECGSLIGAVYWTLAWNEIRVGFNWLLPGTEILSPSNGYYSQPEHFANLAFTYAVASISEDAHLPEFFDRVSEKYYQFEQDGLITSAERHRVNQVLTASCVGWSDGLCSSRHVTTWGVLPVMYTLHQTLSPDIGSREFLRAQHFSLRSGATSHTFADGVFDTPPSKFVTLDSTGEYMEKQVVVPASGNYKLSAAALTHPSCCDSAWVEIDHSGVNHYWDMVGTGSWSWRHNGPTVFLTAGWHTLAIKHRENISLEALLLTRVP